MFDPLKACRDRRKQNKLKTHRQVALLDIRKQRSKFDVMVQRFQKAGCTPDDTFVTDIRGRLEGVEQRANGAGSTDELDDLMEEAEEQGELRAYICPHGEIEDEGNLTINVMEEWNIPKAKIAIYRDSLGQKLKDEDPKIASGALRDIFHEYNSWSAHTEDYEEKIWKYTRWLFAATIILSLLAIFTRYYPPTILFGLLLAGVAGACVSVMAKMPGPDVSLSGDFDVYRRQILCRIGIGAIASLIGCALLGWGLIPISIRDKSFADVLNACTASPHTSCTGLNHLILLCVPMLFGFSERALTSFERIFGSSNVPQ